MPSLAPQIMRKSNHLGEEYLSAVGTTAFETGWNIYTDAANIGDLRWPPAQDTMVPCLGLPPEQDTQVPDLGFQNLKKAT